MAVLLKDAKELTQDKLTQDVIDEFRTSPLLDLIPFDDTVTPAGSTLTYGYNRIVTQPTAQSRKINNEYTAQETVTKRETTDIKIFGGQYKIDRVIARNERQVVSQVEFQSLQKAKAAVAKFHDMFINGDLDTKEEEFNGIEKLMSALYDKEVSVDLSTSDKVKANAQELLYALRQLYKGTKGFNLLLMNDDAYAVFQSVSDVIPNVTYTRDEMGREVYHYNNARIVSMGMKPGTNEQIVPTDENGETVIYGVRLAMDGVHAISPDGTPLVEIFYPDFSTAGAVKPGEVEMLAAIVCKESNAIGKLSGIKVVTPTEIDGENEDGEDPIG